MSNNLKVILKNWYKYAKTKLNNLNKKLSGIIEHFDSKY